MVSATSDGDETRARLEEHIKRTRAIFEDGADQLGVPLARDATAAKVACKIRQEYAGFGRFTKERYSSAQPSAAGTIEKEQGATEVGVGEAGPGGGDNHPDEDGIADIIENAPEPDAPAKKPRENDGALTLVAPRGDGINDTTAGTSAKYSAQIVKHMASRWPRPEWRAPWKLYRVISGHLGWVRSIAFDSQNEWFVTGSADRTIKVWDLASGQLKLTLTGHIEQVTGLAVSPRQPYMFSCGLDKKVLCWDLETNKVIRSYHGHLSGVYSMALHPTLDILFSGGRDSACRVWDMRTKAQIFCLSGHDNTVGSILSQSTDPQVITGSYDSTIKLWDLAAGKTRNTLTFHKKAVRAMAMHPKEYTFASGSADNIKKFKLPDGDFMHNMFSQRQQSIVNSMAVNEDGLLVTGGDNGSLWFWDWASGHNFNQQQTIVQPGSLESENAIYAMAFDLTGTRLLTCEADKTIKFYREDEDATPESDPNIPFKPPKDTRRF